MEIRKRYIVTKASRDGTFEVGDHIWESSDGDIYCVEGDVRIDVSDVPEAIIGMECEIDQGWIERRKKWLLEELAELEK